MPDSEEERFVRQFLACQRDLFRYVVSLVPTLPDAQEVMQEAALALWRKRGEYRPDQPFLPWAKRFAHFEALRFCRKRSRYSPLLAGDLIETLAREREQMDAELEERRRALADCLKRLSQQDRRLLDVRYGAEQTVVEFAAETGRSVHMLRKALVQIRRGLLDCVRGRLATEGAA